MATIATGINRLTEIRAGGGALSKAFTFTAGGDMTQQAVSGGSTFDYVYSPRKRLASVEAGGVEVGSYLYDHAGPAGGAHASRQQPGDPLAKILPSELH